jgi:gamma-glutamyltranspeptidase/glutathione hydrolase
MLIDFSEMGHDARSIPVGGIQRSMMGRGQIIQKLKTPDGSLAWAAGSDLRTDGHAIPQI